MPPPSGLRLVPTIPTMPPSNVDLMPEARRHALGRGYVLRLVTVAAMLGTALAIIAAVLLIPSYTYLLTAKRSAEARLADANAALAAAQAGSLAKQLAGLEADAGTVAAIEATPHASAILRQVLIVGRAGIILTSFNYSAPAAARPGTLALSGTAASRNDLRSFQLALLASPVFATADLPVSSYAKESDIPFTITATLATSTMLGTGTSTAPGTGTAPAP